MKRFLLTFVCMLAMATMLHAETYTHTFASGELKTTGGTVTLSGMEWNASASNYIGWNANGKGIQIGSKNSPCTSYELKSSAFAEYTIKSITVNSSIASSGDAQMTIKAGDATSEAYTLATSDAAYTFDCGSAKGEISITWTATERAYYLSSITIEYQLPAGMVEVPAPTFVTPQNIYADAVNVIAETVNTDVIYYTLDGTTPSYEDYNNGTGTTKSSRTYQIYEKLTATTTIKAMAVRTDGDLNYFSDVVEARYIVSPTMPYQLSSQITSGEKYAIIALDSVATTLIDKEYGYLPTASVIAHTSYTETVAYNGFTFTATDGGYTIQDAEGRYLYMKDNYDSFNLSAEKPAEGAVWSVSINADKAATITNTLKNKTIHYSTKYDSYGCYAADKITDEMVLPNLYLQREYPQVTIDPAENTWMEKFQTITISCPQGIKAGDNLSVVVMEQQMQCKQIDENTIQLSTAEPITTTDNTDLMVFFSGDIMLEPNGMNIPLKLKNSRLMYTLTGNAPAAKIVKVTPANGETIEELSYILFEFDNYVTEVSTDEKLQPRLHAEGSDELFAVEYTTENKDATGKIDHYEGALRITTPITANNTYILEIPSGYFIDRNGNAVDSITLRYIVKNDETGIEDITANEANRWTVYSVTGALIMDTDEAARLGSLPKGIYIVNGKKVIVK